MPKTLDRRAARTQRALRRALTTLLRTKSYDEITVQDILDEADVGRSTFYSHCRGKEDLLRRGLQMLRAELGESGEAPKARGQQDGFGFSLKMLEHVAEHRRIYPSISRGRGREVLFQEMRATVLALLREELADARAMPSIPPALAEELIVGSFMSLVVYWLEHNTMYSPAQIDQVFQRFVMAGLGSYCAGRDFESRATLRT